MWVAIGEQTIEYWIKIPVYKGEQIVFVPNSDTYDDLINFEPHLKKLLVVTSLFSETTIDCSKTLTPNPDGGIQGTIASKP